MTNRTATLTLAALLAVFWACPALAQVSGPCANCHTMHNSQDANPMAVDGVGPWDLLVKECVSCHSATDGDTWKDPVTGAPIVYNTAQPTFGPDAGDGKHQGLAGGNFYWVDQDDSFGHNVFSPDSNLAIAPGRSAGCATADACHQNLDRPYLYRGVMAEGCTCCHTFWDRRAPVIRPQHRYHHADDSATVINSNTQGWYRFIGSIHAGTTGAWGIEDPDWEYTASSTDHNEYIGVVGDKTSSYGHFKDNGKNITAFCLGCHGNMHIQDETEIGASPWIRHPSDAVIPATGEYALYTEYDPLVPVARPELTTVSSVVTPGTDMVMCLSCHRVHGSPYPDMLRWDYNDMQAGGGDGDGEGCFKCHTNKDGS